MADPRPNANMTFRRLYINRNFTIRLYINRNFTINNKYNKPFHPHSHSAKYQQDICNIYISKGVGDIAIKRFLLPNIGRVDNSKTAAFRVVVFICSTPSQPHVQSYHRSIIRISERLLVLWRSRSYGYGRTDARMTAISLEPIRSGDKNANIRGPLSSTGHKYLDLDSDLELFPEMQLDYSHLGDNLLT